MNLINNTFGVLLLFNNEIKLFIYLFSVENRQPIIKGIDPITTSYLYFPSIKIQIKTFLMVDHLIFFFGFIFLGLGQLVLLRLLLIGSSCGCLWLSLGGRSGCGWTCLQNSEIGIEIWLFVFRIHIFNTLTQKIQVLLNLVELRFEALIKGSEVAALANWLTVYLP